MSSHLASLIRDLPDASVAALLRGLPDDVIADIAYDVAALFLGARHLDAPYAEPSAPRPEKARRGLRAKRSNGAGAEDAELLYRTLIAVDALSPADACQLTGLSSSTARLAMKRLRAQGRAFSAGAARSSRWSVTLEGAQAANVAAVAGGA